MEWVGVIIFFVIWIIASLNSSDSPTPQAPRTAASPSSGADATFFGRLTPVPGDDGKPIPGLRLLEVRGFLQAPDATPAYLRAMIYDKEMGYSAPVITLNTEQQASDATVFLCTRTVAYDPGNRIHFEEWTSTGIPVMEDTLVGPKGGPRNLFIAVEIMQADDFMMWRTEIPFSANLDFGYQDIDDRLASNQALSVQLAVAVAATTEGIHDAELTAINTWIKKNTEELETEERSKRRKSLVATLRTAQQRAEAGTLQISKLIGKLKTEGTRSGRMMAVELCFAVMAADGVASADELETVNKIAEKLDVNPQLLSAARDKSLSGLSGGATNDRDRYAILGIDASGDPEQIRSQLSGLYKRWSSRATTLTDPAKRKEAEDMLRLIAEIRAEH
jgi:tellurite resistance protein